MKKGEQALLFDLPAPVEKQSRRKDPAFNKIEVNHEVAKSRYYYHRRLDKNLFRIDGALRSIDCDFKSFEDIPVGPRFYVGRLIGLGYNVQYKAVDVPAISKEELKRREREFHEQFLNNQ